MLPSAILWQLLYSHLGSNKNITVKHDKLVVKSIILVFLYVDGSSVQKHVLFASKKTYSKHI